MPHVVSLAYKPADLERRPEDRFSRVAVERVTLAVGHGIAGDTKGREDSRQLNIITSMLRRKGCLPSLVVKLGRGHEWMRLYWLGNEVILWRWKYTSSAHN
jgi:hypothetical protein